LGVFLDFILMRQPKVPPAPAEEASNREANEGSAGDIAVGGVSRKRVRDEASALAEGEGGTKALPLAPPLEAPSKALLLSAVREMSQVRGGLQRTSDALYV
jgi:hypothetical protein